METPGAASRSIPTVTDWYLYPRYYRWAESLGVPIHRGYAIESLKTVEVGPWEERECNAAILMLEAQAGLTEARVTELPPGGAVRPLKVGVDDLVYVLGGRGLTTLWAYDGGPRRSFEWQKHSLFLLPRNYTYQLSNAQGHESARLLHFNYLPLAMCVIPEPKFFFDNPETHPEIDIFSGEGDLYSQAKVVQKDGSRGTVWMANFFPDIMAWDKLRTMRTRGAGALSSGLYIPNTSHHAGLPIMSVGTYKKAHRHGAGIVILSPVGDGYTIMWPEGGDKMMVPWQEGTFFGPPNQWWHQHFNAGSTPARYLTLHPARSISPVGRGRGVFPPPGVHQIEYTDEDPWIRQTFEEELAKRGLDSLMPDEVYSDPNYQWTYPEEVEEVG